MRSNHSTWDPRRPLYEELKPPVVPRRHYHGSDEHYHARSPGRHKIQCFIFSLVYNWLTCSVHAKYIVQFLNEICYLNYD